MTGKPRTSPAVAGVVPATLAEIVEASPPQDAALIGAGRRLDYAELAHAMRGVSAWLVGLGLPAGTRIAIVQRDGPWAAAMLLGIARAHAAVPLNPALSLADYAFAVADFDVAGVLVEAGCVPAEGLAALGRPVVEFLPWSFPVAAAPAPVAAGPEDAAFLLHTSGTTARPKKVVLSHGRIVRSARVIADALALAAHDRCLTGMPMFHVHGILNAMASTLVSGGAFVHAGPFDVPAFYAVLREAQPTWVTAVPTMYHALAARPELVPPQRRLRFLRSSSAPLAEPLAERLEALFAVPVVSSYGMTEIDPIACTRVGEAAPRGAVGRAAGLDIRLVGSDGVASTDAGEGEIWVRGGRVIAAYEAEPSVNAAAFVDGWFRTGDVARRDSEGWLFLSGRLKEIINRGGEKIAPLEIDAVLLRHPDVVEAAVFGVADAALGEEIAAAVVLRPGATVEPRALRGWLSRRVALHKCPRWIEVVPALPKGPTGKLLRGALRLAPEVRQGGGGQPGGAAASDGDVALVCAVWADILALPTVAPEARYADLGGSSAAALEILTALSARVGRALPIEVLLDGETPTALAAALRRHLEASGEVPS